MITLTMTKDDYYDTEEDVFVMTVGASIKCFQTEVVIKDGTETWDCYLVGVEFIPSTGRGRRDVYQAKYKMF